MNLHPTMLFSKIIQKSNGMSHWKKEATSSSSTLTKLVKGEPKTELEETSNKSNHARKQKYSETILRRVQTSGPSGAEEVRSRRTAYSEISGEFDWHEFEARQNDV